MRMIVTAAGSITRVARRIGRASLAALLLASTALALPAQAGTSCEPIEHTPDTLRKAFALAEKTRATLENSGAQVALLGRIGQDLSRYGQTWSHAAWAWRDHPQGRWLVVHELNECASARSDLFNEGLANFFLDGMHRYEALIVLPGAAGQQRIASLLAQGKARQMHEPQYNMLSYAWSTRYQNSNQWVAETYALAQSDQPIRNRETAQAWLKLAGYAPDTIALPAAVRLGARMFRANVAFDDHPFNRRMAGQIDTVTVDSLTRLIQRQDAEARILVVSED
jgi:hypothetical protein